MIKSVPKLTGCVCLLVALGFMLSGCNSEPLADLQEQSLNLELSAKKSDGKMNFATHLSGDNEVPNPIDTDATGQLIAQISKDELSIHYKLIVANIREDITGSHLHMAPAGANAGFVVNLLAISDFTPNQTAPVNGVLAEGTITADKLVNDLAGMPLSALIDAMRAGNIYVNVHTTVNRGGEIRGQL